MYEATRDNWRAQWNICLSLVANITVPHSFTLLLPTGSLTRGVQPDSGWIPNKTGQCTALYFWSFSTLCYTKQTFWSCFFCARHCKWGNQYERDATWCHAISVKILKRVLQTRRRKQPLKMLYFTFMFQHFRQKSSEINLVWNSFVSTFIQEVHRHIHTGNGKRFQCIHIHMVVKPKAGYPEHRCKEDSDSVRRTGW